MKDKKPKTKKPSNQETCLSQVGEFPPPLYPPHMTRNMSLFKIFGNNVTGYIKPGCRCGVKPGQGRLRQVQAEHASSVCLFLFVVEVVVSLPNTGVSSGGLSHSLLMVPWKPRHIHRKRPRDSWSIGMFRNWTNDWCRMGGGSDGIEHSET